MLGGHELLLDAYRTDVRPLCAGRVPAWVPPRTRSPSTGPRATRPARPRSGSAAAGPPPVSASPASVWPCASPCSSPASTDTLFPQAGRATVELLERLGLRGGVPRGPDLLRADARQHRLPGRVAGPRRPAGRGLRAVRGGRLAVGLVHRLPARARAAAGRDAGDEALARRLEALAPRLHELSQLLVDVLGRRGRGRELPAPGHLPPDVPLAAAAATSATGRCGCCGRCAASTSSSCPRPRSAAASAAPSRSRTPTPRRRCWPTSCAACSDTGAEVCVAADNSCLMHIGGGLQRAAHRRADAAPGRDPGGQE